MNYISITSFNVYDRFVRTFHKKKKIIILLSIERAFVKSKCI